MAKKGSILVGTVGQGIMASGDDGNSWTRISVRNGMHTDGIVRTLVEDPQRPQTVYAGTDMGLYRSDDAGAMHHGAGPLGQRRERLRILEPAAHDGETAGLDVRSGLARQGTDRDVGLARQRLQEMSTDETGGAGDGDDQTAAASRSTGSICGSIGVMPASMSRISPSR